MAAKFGGIHCARLNLYIGRRGVALPDSINDIHARNFTIHQPDTLITDGNDLERKIRRY